MRSSYTSIERLPGGKSETPTGKRPRDPHTVAWVILWTAFAIFWALVIGAFLAAKHYYDTATVPRTAVLSLEQGIVLFRDAVSSTMINAHDNLSLREGDDLLVGQGARASVTFSDGSFLRLYSGSQLRFGELRKSRFHEGFSRVALRLEKGIARLQIAPPSTAASLFLVTTPHGSFFLSEGNFGLDVGDSRTRISSREGTASASAAGGTVRLAAGEKAILSKDGVAGPMPEGDQLLVNGDFSQGFAGWELLQVHEPGRPEEPGQRMLLTQKIGGKEMVALRISRVSRLATHNETGLIQVLNRDVSDYRSLQLHAAVRVDEQSLSGGGYMGYEYPIMLRVRYRDATGGQIDWSHGFFHKNPEGRPTPNGQEVPQGQWVIYEGDLMEVKQKPVHIISVEVLAAGHSFDGMIADVGLIGK